MPCPFPGMDPYLELPPFWGDFAPTFLTDIRNGLLPQLLPKYDARIEEYLLVKHEDVTLRRVQPDMAITTSAGQSSGPIMAVAEATMVELEYPEFEPQKQRSLKVIHQESGEVVSVMELLSPINKAAGDVGQGAYLEKRAELLASSCHLVELDLLRGGSRLPMVGSLPLGDYYAYIGRTSQRPRCQTIAWSLRSPLPDIPIPLLPEDPDATLHLAEAFRSAYEPSLYDRRLPYGKSLVPILPSSDEEWVRARLAAMKTNS